MSFVSLHIAHFTSLHLPAILTAFNTLCCYCLSYGKFFQAIHHLETHWILRSCHCPAWNDILTPQPTASHKPGCFSSSLSSNWRWLAWHPTPARRARPLPVPPLDDDSLRQRFWGAIWWSAIVLHLRLLDEYVTLTHMSQVVSWACGIPLPERIRDSLAASYVLTTQCELCHRPPVLQTTGILLICP